VAWRFLTRPGSLVERLRLEGDDPQLDVLPDGVRAVDLVQDVHLIPGLWKIDGYSGFRAMVTDAFKVEVGTIRADDQRVANYFEFPYDWRRDNRVAARQLKRVVDERLHRWRTETPFKDAKAILVAHSMGGLVARYYVEVLGGWTDCKALVTIGTPHRGSVKAVDFLANGNRLMFADLTDMIRSLTSVYQLLPRYRMVEENGRFCRVTETDAEMPGIDRKRGAEALRFHDEIQAAVEARPSRGYELIPIVGTWQPTMQAARLAHGRVTVDTIAPTWTEFPEGDGDGTVPRVSAVPIEHSDAWLNTFVAESHSSLQNHAGILQDLRDRVIQSQVRTGHIRGAVTAAQPAPALALHVDDLYAHDERIELQVGVKNIDVGDVTAVRVKVTEAANGATMHEGPCALSDGVWSGVLSSLPPGTYRVAVTATASPRALEPVHDVFAVAER
jgi:pimeloyl-ACP methyl ester carboxylesterase